MVMRAKGTSLPPDSCVGDFVIAKTPDNVESGF